MFNKGDLVKLRADPKSIGIVLGYDLSFYGFRVRWLSRSHGVLPGHNEIQTYSHFSLAKFNVQEG